MNITSIDGKLDVSWHPEILTVLESWSDYDVELESFRKAVFVKGINHIKASRGKAWIFDPGTATGSFGPEVQAMIDADRFAALGWTGAKYFVTINPAATDISVNTDTEHTRGVQRVEAPSVEGAMAWIKAQP
ncbi:MAG: hypothetical protein IV090_02630 [Candidatus Sericytochromatia bacterium]|nr:hypothetical protein [Candidatus Sericytochromatia bacterium]